jgi:hypothetical protein
MAITKELCEIFCLIIKYLNIHMEDCLLVSDYSHVSGPECQLVSDRFNIEFVPMETMNRNGLLDGTIKNL